MNDRVSVDRSKVEAGKIIPTIGCIFYTNEYVFNGIMNVCVGGQKRKNDDGENK